MTPRTLILSGLVAASTLVVITFAEQVPAPAAAAVDPPPVTVSAVRPVLPAPTPDVETPTHTVAAAPSPSPTVWVVPEPWASLADCESGEWAGDGTPTDGTATWDATAGVHEGGLQFAPDTWDWLRDDDMPDHAYDATPRQQVEVAERVLARQGWRAWPVCARKLGLR